MRQLTAKEIYDECNRVIGTCPQAPLLKESQYISGLGSYTVGEHIQRNDVDKICLCFLKYNKILSDKSLGYFNLLNKDIARMLVDADYRNTIRVYQL